MTPYRRPAFASNGSGDPGLVPVLILMALLVALLLLGTRGAPANAPVVQLERTLLGS